MPDASLQPVRARNLHALAGRIGELERIGHDIGVGDPPVQFGIAEGGGRERVGPLAGIDDVLAGDADVARLRMKRRST